MRALTVLALLLPLSARGVIVDRVAVTVGDKVITDSEIDLRIRLTAFQNDEKPEFSLASRRKAAEELIDQKLIEHEMDLGHYPRLEAKGRKALLDEYAAKNYHSDPAAMAKALTECGLTPEELEEDLGRQSDLLTFLNLRFRPAVDVTDQDVQKYLDEHVTKEELQKVQPAALQQLRAQIEQKLTTERSEKELDLWLEDQHKRTKIEFLEKDLQAK